MSNAPTMQAVDRFLSGLFEQPGFLTWWQQEGREVFTEDFREYAERAAP